MLRGQGTNMCCTHVKLNWSNQLVPVYVWIHSVMFVNFCNCCPFKLFWKTLWNVFSCHFFSIKVKQNSIDPRFFCLVRPKCPEVFIFKGIFSIFFCILRISFLQIFSKSNFYEMLQKVFPLI